MRTIPLAIASLAVAVGQSLAAQGNKLEFGRRVVLHGPVAIDRESVGAVCGGPDSVACVRKALGAVLESAPSVYVNQATEQHLQPGEFSFYLYILAQTKEPVADERADEILTALVHDLEPRFDVLLRQHALQSGQRQLAGLSDHADKLEAEYLELRKRAAVMLRADQQTAAAIAADLDKQRLNVELDLRTEQSVQQHLQDLLAEAEKKRTEVVDHLRQLADKKAKLLTSVLDMQKMPEGTRAEETARARQQLEGLQLQVRDTETAYNQLSPEAKRQADLIDTLAEDARKSALTVNRLTTRFELLQKFAAEQQKALAEAEVAGAERDAALLRADDVKARMQALRQRAEEIRVRLDAMEPVRLEIWK